MKFECPPNNLPRDVVRVLASHGAVQVSTHELEGGARIPCAPFEDYLYLFVSPGSATETALLKTTRLSVSAKDPDGEYQVRMEGRGNAGRPLPGHPLFSSLDPWRPEGVSSHRLLVVPFVAEEIEFVQGRGDQSKRHAGTTRGGNDLPTRSRIWLGACFSGLAGFLALLYTALCVGWLGAQGADFVGRPFAVVLCLIGGLGLIGGVRLMVIAQGFLLWRRHKCSASDAPWLVDSFIAPTEARMFGVMLLVAAAVSLSIISMVWGSGLMWKVVIACGILVAAPAWVMHLAMGRPEPQR